MASRSTLYLISNPLRANRSPRNWNAGRCSTCASGFSRQEGCQKDCDQRGNLNRETGARAAVRQPMHDMHLPARPSCPPWPQSECSSRRATATQGGGLHNSDWPPKTRNGATATTQARDGPQNQQRPFRRGPVRRCCPQPTGCTAWR